MDQNTLPPEDRIPVTLEDVEVRIVEAAPPPEPPESNCDYSMCAVSSEEGTDGVSIANVNTRERRREVREKYEPLFWRQPDVHGVAIGRMRDENGKVTNTWGITIHVAKKVDQNTLSPEDRIPDCLEGIPTQIVDMGGRPGLLTQ